MLLVGYFRYDIERLKTVGLFRVTASDARLRELEVHMSQGDYGYLSTVTDGHLVANHLKRIFREMAEPLFPDELYDEFERVGYIADEERKVEGIRELLERVKESKPLNYYTI